MEPTKPSAPDSRRRPAPRPAERRHPRAGIASFVLALLSAAGLAASYAFAAGLGAEPAPGSADATPALSGAVAAAVVAVLSFLLALVGAVLGLAGSFQKNRPKRFSVLGLALNALISASIVLAMLWAALAGPALPTAG